MPLDENPFLERLKKMPPVIAVCAVIGAAIGAIPAVLIARHIISIRATVGIFTLFMGGGFCLGVIVGVTIDTLVFRPRREKEEKRQRRLRRRMEEKARKAGL
jgi:uncharacterized membrane protein YgaE (UPF0421/DUF939 family)